jgi:hypothetical protein
MRRLWMVALLCSAVISLNNSYAAPRPACLNDAKKLCASVIHDDEARRRCMRGHAAELSEGCKAAVAADRRDSGQVDTAKVNQCIARCAARSPGARASFQCGEACATGRYQRPSGY